MKSLWLFFLFAATAMAQSLPMTVGMCINPFGNLIEMAGSSAMQPYHGNLPQTVVMGGAADGAYHPLQCDANGYLITGSTSLTLTTNGSSGAATWNGTTLNIPVYSGGSTLTLTTNGSSGAATWNGTTLNIPQYTTAITLTTNGSNGASTWNGTTLNIPQYAPVLTTTGSTGAATFDGTTLNIPVYSNAATVNSLNTLTGTLQLIGGTALSVYSPSAGVLQIDYTGGSTTPTGYQPNQTLAGCGVEYISGLQYSIGSCSYTINGVTYSSLQTNETLSADPSNDRIDVIGVDNTGSVVVLVGTPSSNPQAPTIDPSTQLQLTFVYIPAGASTPANTTLATIFDEGTEWTQTYTAHLALSTNNPYRGTHDVEATSAVLNNSVYFQNSTTIDPANYNNLVFYIRSKAQWPTGTSGATAARSLAIWWSNGNTQKGQQVILRDGQFGFSSSNTTTYQQISLPLSLFGANGNPVNRLHVQVAGNSGTSSIGFYLDAVSLQGGNGSTPAIPTTIMNYRGTWNATTAYNTNDLVVTNNVGYVALAANTNIPLTTQTAWQQIGPGTFVNDTITCSGTSCTLNHTPVTFMTLSRNGILQRVADFSQSGTAVTLSVAAVSGDTFTAQYFY